jgi:hypothetical protein
MSQAGSQQRYVSSSLILMISLLSVHVVLVSEATFDLLENNVNCRGAVETEIFGSKFPTALRNKSANLPVCCYSTAYSVPSSY